MLLAIRVEHPASCKPNPQRLFAVRPERAQSILEATVILQSAEMQQENVPDVYSFYSGRNQPTMVVGSTMSELCSKSDLGATSCRNEKESRPFPPSRPLRERRQDIPLLELPPSENVSRLMMV
jgi:hypothetical protein